MCFVHTANSFVSKYIHVNNMIHCQWYYYWYCTLFVIILSPFDSKANQECFYHPKQYWCRDDHLTSALGICGNLVQVARPSATKLTLPQIPSLDALVASHLQISSLPCLWRNKTNLFFRCKSSHFDHTITQLPRTHLISLQWYGKSNSCLVKGCISVRWFTIEQMVYKP